jgi:hypothetical protein
VLRRPREASPPGGAFLLGLTNFVRQSNLLQCYTIHNFTEDEMATTIRISDPTEEHIKHHGKFGETHDDVLIRLLGIQSTNRKKRSKPRIKGEFTSQEEFVPIILKILLVADDCELPMKDVLSIIKTQTNLTDVDLCQHESGSVRWENNAQWARKKLVDRGHLYKPSEVGRGIWKLTPAGVKLAKTLLA